MADLGLSLVTGVSGALGNAVAIKLIEEGLDVVGVDISPPKINSKQFRFERVDLTQAQEVRSLGSSLKNSSRVIQNVVHCAGGFRFAKIEDLKDEDLEFLIDLNFKSAFLLAREIIPFITKSSKGSIVFVSAGATASPGLGMGAYAASKLGIHALVSSLVAELKEYSININAILPSIIDTPANRRDMPTADFKKWVSLKSIAEVIHMLLSPAGEKINGSYLSLPGKV